MKVFTIEMLFGPRLAGDTDMLLVVLAILFASGLLGAIMGAVIASVFKRDKLLSDKAVTVLLSTLPVIPVSYQCTSVMSRAVGQGALANPGILMMTALACFPGGLIISIMLSFFWRSSTRPDQGDA